MSNSIEKIKEAMQALDEANVLMCNAIESFLTEKFIVEEDGDCTIAVKFNVPVEVSSNSPIIGLCCQRVDGKVFVYYFDEDGCDDIDDSDLSANELYEICNILENGQYYFEKN